MNDTPQKPRSALAIGAILAALIFLTALLYLVRDYLPRTSLTQLGERAFGELSVSF